MPKAAPQWKSKMPEFLEKITSAQCEDDIKDACEAFKRVVVECYPDTPDSRRRAVGEARKSLRSIYPTQLRTEKEAPFPYIFMKDGYKKGKGDRWEHLAIEYLEEEWNRKEDRSFEQIEEVAKPEVDILDEVGLTNDEVEQVKKALGESDVREWVRQAIMQRANAINNKKAVMDEDLSEVPSEILMNEKKYRTNPTAARELVNRGVRVVKQWNHDNPDQKWCITNKLIGELTGVTVKAIAKAVEGMDLEGYNKHHNLTPVVNRLIKASVGEAIENMSIAKVTGIEGTETDYQP
jgi:hypothetical protein